MRDVELGSALRLLRHRRGWRQEDVSARTGLSRSIVSMVERGRAGELTVSTVRKVAAALDVPLGWEVGWRQRELEQLRDAAHAALQNDFKLFLERYAWWVQAEVSFSHYGDRGRVDLLAYHPVSRVVLVVEIKTSIVDAQALIGGLHVKERLAHRMAADLGWAPLHVTPAIVIKESSTARRRIAAHAALFGRYGLRGSQALGWLRKPHGAPDGILLFTTLSDSNRVAGRRAARQRVRTRSPHTSTRSDESAPHRRPAAGQ